MRWAPGENAPPAPAWRVSTIRHGVIDAKLDGPTPAAPAGDAPGTNTPTPATMPARIIMVTVATRNHRDGRPGLDDACGTSRLTGRVALWAWSLPVRTTAQGFPRPIEVARIA